uniref:Uncharacterized protein n=1 Tax=Physcomitrium patens TaxID=3218 RepID=A0A2K1IXP0_PHYPA|nr:hypothetical protein PHYPA_023859 [Physcomitrium patens]
MIGSILEAIICLQAIRDLGQV